MTIDDAEIERRASEIYDKYDPSGVNIVWTAWVKGFKACQKIYEEKLKNNGDVLFFGKSTQDITIKEQNEK